MEKFYRIIIVITILVTGLAGSLTVLGISLFITYDNSFEGELLGFMCYTGLIYYFIFFAIIYLFGFTLLVVYTMKHGRK